MGGTRITGNKDADTGLYAAAILLTLGSGQSGAGGSHGKAATPAASSNAAGTSTGGMSQASSAITPAAGTSLGGMSQASSAITPSFSSLGNAASSNALSGLGGMANGFGQVGNAALANSFTYSPKAEGIMGAGISGTGGGTGTVGGVAGSDVYKNGLSDALKKLSKLNEGYQDIMKLRNEYENPPTQMGMPVQTPEFFSGNSAPQSSAPSPNVQSLDQFSQRLQSELQKIINKQKNGRW